MESTPLDDDEAYRHGVVAPQDSNPLDSRQVTLGSPPIFRHLKGTAPSSGSKEVIRNMRLTGRAALEQRRIKPTESNIDNWP
jgi:hypothetical protein